MLLFTVSFLLGDIFLQSFQTLPHLKLIAVLLLIASFSAFLRKYKIAVMLIGLLLGFCYTTWYAHSVLAWVLPTEWETKPALISGYIKSIPNTTEFGTQFEFLMQQNVLIKLNWRDAPLNLKVGDHWQFLAKLKRIHSIQSPGAFDFEAWALQNQLRATGYILASKETQLLGHHYWRYPINQFRQEVLRRLQLVLPQSDTSHWLPALIVGERQGIAQDQWQVLRNTGTNHLMAIGGLHIGILAAGAHVIVNRLWRRRERWMLMLPAQHASAIAAFATAFFYSTLAGFSIPTQRACLMLFVYNLSLLRNRCINPWYAWSLALFVVLIFNPLVTLNESFWLSFVTLALIIYGMSGRLAPSGWWWKWGRVQYVIGVGLIPITLVLFQQASFISFVANTIAIPWLAFFILPWCFISSMSLFISTSISKVLLLCADKSLAGLWFVLTELSHLHLAIWQQVIPNNFYLVLTILAAILILLPNGLPGRWLSICCALPFILYQTPRPEFNQAKITVLDVGQGLATVVQTQQHTLVYDTGPKFNADLDMGENVVLPYLRTQYVKNIDMLVISHGDNDHTGGAQALFKALPVTAFYTSVPEKFPQTAAQLCLANYQWQWDGITFKFIYPGQNDLHANNDSSCVLKIDNGMQSIILPGDVEKYAEQQLLENNLSDLATSIIVAPHHGSKTSGPLKFVRAVNPRFVIYSTGFKNRYHFPHKSVVENYASLNASQWNTAELGTLEFSLLRQGKLTQPDAYRRSHQRYWFDH